MTNEQKNNRFSSRLVSISLMVVLFVTMMPFATSVSDIKGDDFTAYAATKKITVKFNANGGTVSKKSISVKKDAKYGTLPAPKRSGYYFQGWYTKKSGGKDVTKTSVMKSDKTVNLYAQWSRIPAKYKNNIGKTLGTLKNKDKAFKNLGHYSYEDAAADIYGIKGSKVRYITMIGQGVWAPSKYFNNFTKMKNIKVLGLEGEISAIFPGIKKEMSYKDFLKYLGVKKYEYNKKQAHWSSSLSFKYQGYDVWIYWADGEYANGKFLPPTIKPKQHVSVVNFGGSDYNNNIKIGNALLEKEGF